MLKTTIPVIVSSVKVAKEATKSNYAEFVFMGGNANVPVDKVMTEKLQPLVGKETVVTFEIKPEIRKGAFDRPETFFKTVGVLSVDDEKKRP